MDMEFDESILAWHLATDEFLTKYSESADAKPLVEATKAVSNYMMFLLVERPYMLPSPLFDPHCISKPGKCCSKGGATCGSRNRTKILLRRNCRRNRKSLMMEQNSPTNC